MISKVLLPTEEWARLKKIERHCQQLTKQKEEKRIEQSGTGSGCSTTCSPKTKARKNQTLSEIVMTNERSHALETPVPGIIPSITAPLENERVVTTGSGLKNRDVPVVTVPNNWWYIGPA